MEAHISKDLTGILVRFHATGQPGTQVGRNVPALQKQPGQHAVKGGRGIVHPMIMYESADISSNARLPLKPMGTDEVQQGGLLGWSGGSEGASGSPINSSAAASARVKASQMDSSGSADSSGEDSSSVAVSSSTAGKVDSGPPPSSPLASAASTWSPQEMEGAKRSVSTGMGAMTATGEEGGATPVVGVTSCDGSGINGNHGRGMQEVGGDSREGVGGGIAGGRASNKLPPDGVGPRRPGKRKPGHSLAKAAPLPVP